jgi:hypothetical protein
MPMIEITPKDLKASAIVKPAWYRVLVTKVGDMKVSSSGKSNVCFPEGEILFNADDGSKEFEGVPTPVSWNFNDSARGKQDIIGFVSAITGSEVKDPQRIDLSAAENKEVDIFIDNDLYEGKMQNRISGKYRTPR